MLKFFHLSTALLTIFIPLFPEIILTRPLSGNPRYPEVPSSNVNALMCYFQTADGRTLNLDTLCTETSGDNRSSSGASIQNSGVREGTNPPSSTLPTPGIPGSPPGAGIQNSGVREGTNPPSSTPQTPGISGSPPGASIQNSGVGEGSNSSNSTPQTPGISGSPSGSNLGANQCYAFDAAGRPCAASTENKN